MIFAIRIGPLAIAVGGQIMEIEGARREYIQRGGAQRGGDSVFDLFDGRVANGGVAIFVVFILQIRDQDRFDLFGGLERGHHAVEIPLIVGFVAIAIGGVLARVVGTAQFIVVARAIPDMETVVGILDLHVGEVLGLVRIVVRARNETITDASHAAQRIPGLFSPCAIVGILLRGNRAKIKRPAISQRASRRLSAIAFIGALAGVAELQLRSEPVGTSWDREGIAIGELPGVTTD